MLLAKLLYVDSRRKKSMDTVGNSIGEELKNEGGILYAKYQSGKNDTT